MAKTTTSVTSPKQQSRAFKPLKIHTILRTARNRAPQDCHSEGHDSEFSGEDDDIDGELLDTVMADYEERERASVKKHSSKKTFIRSKTYGLCHFSREDVDDDLSSTPPLKAMGTAEESHTSHGEPRDVNKKSNDAFTHSGKHTPQGPDQHNVRILYISGLLIIGYKSNQVYYKSLLSVLCQNNHKKGEPFNA